MRSLLLVLALAIGGSGCYARATYSSPAPRVVYVSEYPGWLWVEGNYYWNGARWVWVEGYWIQDRPGYVYAPGYYHPYSHVWIAGTWSTGHHHHYYSGGTRYQSYGGGRDHRTYYHSPPSSGRSSRGRRGH